MSADDLTRRRKLPKRAVNMREAIEWLEASGRNEIVTRDLTAVTREGRYSGTARVLAARLVKRGVLRRLFPGKYEVLRSGAPRSVTIADELRHWMGDEYAVVYATAMFVHGLAPDLAGREPLHVLRKRGGPTTLPKGLTLELVCHYQAEPLADVEVVPNPALGQVQVRSARSTLFDALAFPQYSGGLHRAAAFVGLMLRRTSAAELVRASEGVTRRAAICRLGLLLELAGVAPEVLAGLSPRLDGRYFELDPAHRAKGDLNSNWRIRLNVPLEPLRAAVLNAAQ